MKTWMKASWICVAIAAWTTMPRSWVSADELDGFQPPPNQPGPADAPQPPPPGDRNTGGGPPDRAGPVGAGPDRSGPDRAGPGGGGLDRAGLGGAGRGGVDQEPGADDREVRLMTELQRRRDEIADLRRQIEEIEKRAQGGDAPPDAPTLLERFRQNLTMRESDMKRMMDERRRMLEQRELDMQNSRLSYVSNWHEVAFDPRRALVMSIQSIVELATRQGHPEHAERILSDLLGKVHDVGGRTAIHFALKDLYITMKQPERAAEHMLQAAMENAEALSGPRNAPRSDAQRGDGPRNEPPRGEVPRGDVPRGEVPRGEAPRGDGPRGDAQRGDAPPARLLQPGQQLPSHLGDGPQGAPRQAPGGDRGPGRDSGRGL
ncbi:MAG: hypothetical protein IT449_16730 [Phycisphaerales bacterium]|nr:hypothetical protein [Phycisphaerales bacterium]